MISFFELESQKFDELYQLKIKRKLSSSQDVWLEAKIEACLELIDKDFDPNETNEEGERILGHIIMTGRLDLVKFLVESGAEVNICGYEDDYPLHMSARQASREIYNYLEPLTTSTIKGRILLQATINNEYEVIQALIDSGINVDAHREKGIRDLNGYGTGDQLLHINVWTPKKLSNQEKEILGKLKDSPNFQMDIKSSS